MMHIFSIPLFSAGFRPFFLLGSFAGITSIAVWLLTLSGHPLGTGQFLHWHGHEMIFGFATAIVMGFLYTASQNWTKKRGVHGLPLALVSMLWIMGRVAMLIPSLDPMATMILDALFLPVAAILLAPYLLRRDQRHNMGFLLLLVLLWICNVIFHLDRIGLWAGGMRLSLYMSLHSLLLMIAVFAQRVIPFFSQNALENYQRRNNALLDRTILTTITAHMVLFPFIESSPILGLLAIFISLAIFFRLFLWYDHRIWGKPILCILHIGYGWLAVGFSLYAGAAFGWWPLSYGLHALALGAVGTVIIAMVSRVSLGHTGRVIRANKGMIAAYVFVTLASLIRIMGAFVPALYLPLILQLAGILWILAILMLLLTLWPVLTTRRADGKTG